MRPPSAPSNQDDTNTRRYQSHYNELFTNISEQSLKDSSPLDTFLVKNGKKNIQEKETTNLAHMFRIGDLFTPIKLFTMSI